MQTLTHKYTHVHTHTCMLHACIHIQIINANIHIHLQYYIRSKFRTGGYVIFIQISTLPVYRKSRDNRGDPMHSLVSRPPATLMENTASTVM